MAKTLTLLFAVVVLITTTVSAIATDDCSQQQFCQDCTVAASGSCGWCQTGGVGIGACQSGSSTGPSGGQQCDGSWFWQKNTCP